MKRITIFRTNSEKVQVMDDDDTNLTEYSTNLSHILEASNVVILETSEGNIIVKPTKIDLILVSEELTNDNGDTEQPKEPQEDVVTEEEV